MDSKEQAKIYSFLGNSSGVETQDDEIKALQKLLKLLGEEAYLKGDISE